MTMQSTGSFLVAFGRKPRPGFLSTFRQLAQNEGAMIDGAILRPGPGCYNLGFIVTCENPEIFAEMITFVLMPAKYERTTDPELRAGTYIEETE